MMMIRYIQLIMILLKRIVRWLRFFVMEEMGKVFCFLSILGECVRRMLRAIGMGLKLLPLLRENGKGVRLVEYIEEKVKKVYD